MDITKISDTFAVSPQILATDMPMLKAQGMTTIINNRPDGEEGHPSTSAQLQAAAQALGMTYHFIPVVGMNFPQAAVSEMAQIVGQPSGKVLAFCRTGNRSINMWARANKLADTGVDVQALVANTAFKLV
ncbi:MAG: TIGR01244 family phosphatase [Oceanospirillaceae bacterium]|nr:TIGR01244 family phosphatase [Oceanospirillaceae bacterium]